MLARFERRTRSHFYMGVVATSSVIALTEEAICHAHYYGASDIKSNRGYFRAARKAASAISRFESRARRAADVSEVRIGLTTCSPLKGLT